jgi:hypothetical protein
MKLRPRLAELLRAGDSLARKELPRVLEDAGKGKQ